MTRQKKVSCARIAAILLAFPVLLQARPDGPEPGRAGDPPNNRTCISAGCHSGTANSGGGKVEILLPAGNTGTYVPGQTMQILVRITDSAKASYGFQMAALRGSATQAGDFTNTDSNPGTSLTQVYCADGSPKANGAACGTSLVQYIEHTFNGYSASLKTTPKGSYTYTVNWTPPAAGSGKVTLYAAANCGTGGPSSFSTNVYTTTMELTEASSGATPSINAGGIGPIYSKATTVQPGSWISIYGANLVSSTEVWNGSPPTPTTLGGASVTINGKPAYLWVAVPKVFGNTDQINVQAPDDTATGTVTVAVTNQANGTATSTVTLGSVGPSFSVLGDAGGHAAGVILTPGGTGAYGGGTYDIDGPAGSSLGYPTRPVKAGEVLLLYGVGFGPTTPAVPSGQAFASAAPLTQAMRDTFQLTIGGVTVPNDNISFVGLAGQGLYQITVTVPPGLGPGDKALVATVAGVSTPTGVVLAVQ